MVCWGFNQSRSRPAEFVQKKAVGQPPASEGMSNPGFLYTCQPDLYKKRRLGSLLPARACPTPVFCTLASRICTKNGGWAGSGWRDHVQPWFFVHLPVESVQKKAVGQVSACSRVSTNQISTVMVEY